VEGGFRPAKKECNPYARGILKGQKGCSSACSSEAFLCKRGSRALLPLRRRREGQNPITLIEQKRGEENHRTQTKYESFFQAVLKEKDWRGVRKRKGIMRCMQTPEGSLLTSF